MSKFKFHFSKGVLQAILGALIFALMGLFVKLASEDLTAIQIVFYRNVVGVTFILSSILKSPLKNKGGRFGLLMFRGFIGVLSLYALYYNIGKIGLGEAITFIQTSTIFVAVFSMIFLKEMLSIWGWLALVIGFTGIVFVFQPDLDTGLAPNILGIFNGVAAGAAYTSVRRLKSYYDTRSIVLSFMGWGLILPIISMLIYPFIDNPHLDFMISPFDWPTGINWVWAFMVGITAMLGQIFLTKAYGNEKAGIVSTVGYINIPFAILFGILLGDNFPDPLSIIGILFIIISGVVISIRRNI